MKVKNVNGSSRFPKPADFDSWLDYWEYYKGKLKFDTRYNCPACGEAFFRNGFVGAHVHKVSSSDESWYIVPLCRGCNQRDDSFDVDINILQPVPSNRKN